MFTLKDVSDIKSTTKHPCKALLCPIFVNGENEYCLDHARVMAEFYRTHTYSSWYIFIGFAIGALSTLTITALMLFR